MDKENSRRSIKRFIQFNNYQTVSITVNVYIVLIAKNNQVFNFRSILARLGLPKPTGSPA